MTDTSQEIGKLATALSKAQGKITGALKDSKNPFFKSSYADLASIMEAIRGPLSENELAYVQTTDIDEQGVTVVTTLAHSSGEWIRGKLRMFPKDATPQGIGSCITYARRYALAAIVGVAQVDDDANQASGRTEPNGKADPRPEGWKTQDTKKVTEASRRIMEAVDNGHDVKEIWDEYRSDEVFATAVWATLPKPIQNFIRDEVKKRA